MPTPTDVFAQLAAKYGDVDPSDIEAVQHWYEKVLPTLVPGTIETVLSELISQDGPAETTQAPHSYPDKAPLPTLEQSPPVALPMLASGWRRYLRQFFRPSARADHSDKQE
jgi:hypothetical protein